MTAKEKLHRHLTELEDGQVFSHERMKDMAELIDSLASPLPVKRLEQLHDTVISAVKEVDKVDHPLIYNFLDGVRYGVSLAIQDINASIQEASNESI